MQCISLFILVSPLHPTQWKQMAALWSRGLHEVSSHLRGGGGEESVGVAPSLQALSGEIRPVPLGLRKVLRDAAGCNSALYS